jgi:alkaline phosphatase
VIGVDGFVEYGNCKSSLKHEVNSIARWAHDAGKSVGIVTTTRVTHASPAGLYAHTASREWEAFDNIEYTQKQFDDGCKDIAAQLIDDNSYINVIVKFCNLKK